MFKNDPTIWCFQEILFVYNDKHRLKQAKNKKKRKNPI